MNSFDVLFWGVVAACFGACAGVVPNTKEKGKRVFVGIITGSVLLVALMCVSTKMKWLPSKWLGIEDSNRQDKIARGDLSTTMTLSPTSSPTPLLALDPTTIKTPSPEPTISSMTISISTTDNTPTPIATNTMTPMPTNTPTSVPSKAPTATNTPIPINSPTPTPFVVTFDGNGGRVSENNRLVKRGEAYGTLPAATREGYTLDGWYNVPNGGDKVTASTTVASSHTLYAHWIASTVTRKIVYRSQNGNMLGSTTETHNCGEIIRLTPPSYDGYKTPVEATINWGTETSDYVFVYDVDSVSNTAKSGLIWDTPYAGYTVTLELGERTETSINVRVKFDLSMGSGWTVYGARFLSTVFAPGTPQPQETPTGEVTIIPFREWQAQVDYTRNATAYSAWITVPLADASSDRLNMWVDIWWFNSNGTNMYNYDGTNGVRKLFENIPIPKY